MKRQLKIYPSRLIYWLRGQISQFMSRLSLKINFIEQESLSYNKSSINKDLRLVVPNK